MFFSWTDPIWFFKVHLWKSFWPQIKHVCRDIFHDMVSTKLRVFCVQFSWTYTIWFFKVHFRELLVPQIKHLCGDHMCVHMNLLIMFPQSTFETIIDVTNWAITWCFVSSIDPMKILMHILENKFSLELTNFCALFSWTDQIWFFKVHIWEYRGHKSSMYVGTYSFWICLPCFLKVHLIQKL